MGLSPARSNTAGAPGGIEGLAARRTAATLLRKILSEGQSLDALLNEDSGLSHFRGLDPRDRSLSRAIVGTALRRRGEILAAIDERLDRPLKDDTGELSAILEVGAAQILFLDVPDHAAVSLAVEQAALGRKTRNARPLVNGVLRRIARERDAVLAESDATLRNTPEWLRHRWARAYGEDTARAIAAAHLPTPDLDISVKSDPERWAERLGGILLPGGTIRLSGSHRVPDLPGFAEGEWWVQDFAASLPARLLGDVAGRRVADLCAAPGGKTAELAARGAYVTAVDISASRLRRTAQNLDRLGLKAELITADVLEWQPDRPFDAVLLDAPCSATGTIRRHPDIPWLKSEADVASLAGLQARLLDRVANWLMPGGCVVFCTCSLEPEEGEEQVARFLASHPEFAPDPVDAGEVGGLSDLVKDGALRTLPCHGFADIGIRPGMDGFFAARLRRN